MPIGGSGNRVVYRKSWVNEAGYDTIPGDLDGFLDMSTKLKAKGHPIGFALGNATGDANSWCHWLMWTFGGSLTDENDQVIINSKETVEALKYGKELYRDLHPGHALLARPEQQQGVPRRPDLHSPSNGISIYYAAKNSQDPNVKAMAEDIYHAQHAVRPGRQADRARADRQPDDLQVHQVPERGQGVPAVHDGEGAVRSLAERLDRLL